MTDVQEFCKAHGGKYVRLRGSQGGTPTFVCPDGASVTCGMMNTYLVPVEWQRKLRYQREYYQELCQAAEVDARDLGMCLDPRTANRAKPWTHPAQHDWRRQHYGDPVMVETRFGNVPDGATQLARLRAIIEDCRKELQRIDQELAAARPAGAVPVGAAASFDL
jgi:hypothetical protein